MTVERRFLNGFPIEEGAVLRIQILDEKTLVFAGDDSMLTRDGLPRNFDAAVWIPANESLLTLNQYWSGKGLNGMGYQICFYLFTIPSTHVQSHLTRLDMTHEHKQIRWIILYIFKFTPQIVNSHNLNNS